MSKTYFSDQDRYLAGDQFPRLFQAVVDAGYSVVGPKIKKEAIVLDRLRDVDDLPRGYQDRQAPGEYRLVESDSPAWFDYAVGSQSPKRWLYPSRQQLWQVTRTENGFKVNSNNRDSAEKYALIGIRPCELKALALFDKVVAGPDHVDPTYEKLRKNSLIVAVNCTRPGGTCFCDSMDSGPAAHEGYDIVITEMIENENHFFILKSGSKKGEKIVASLDLETASPEQRNRVEQKLERATAHMGREIDSGEARVALLDQFNSMHWRETAKRCLSCGNCTLVCPTCFCSGAIDQTDLTASEATRVRQWDSCFMVDFSYIHGGSIRYSVRSRYRQWLTHKFAYWHEQYGEAGCVGCGRCITWCPVGIDITEEVSAIAQPAAPAMAD